MCWPSPLWPAWPHNHRRPQERALKIHVHSPIEQALQQEQAQEQEREQEQALLHEEEDNGTMNVRVAG